MGGSRRWYRRAQAKENTSTTAAIPCAIASPPILYNDITSEQRQENYNKRSM